MRSSLGKIVETYLKLSRGSHLKDVRIKDIMKEANLNRQTFYYYFSFGIEELNSFTVDKIIFGETKEKLSRDNFVEYGKICLENIVKNKDFLKKCIIYDVDNIRKSLNLGVSKNIFEAFSNEEKIIKYGTGYFSFVSTFLNKGMVETLIEWIKNDCTTSVDDIVVYMSKSIYSLTDPLIEELNAQNKRC